MWKQAYCPICGDVLVCANLKLSSHAIICEKCNRKYKDSEMIWKECSEEDTNRIGAGYYKEFKDK